MRFISKKFGDEKFNFLNLLDIEGKIKKIYIASAYFDTDVIYDIKNHLKDQVSASGCDFVVFTDQCTVNAKLKDKTLRKKYLSLSTRLKNEFSPFSGIFSVKNKGKLFHSKIFFIETTKYIKVFLGSMNFTERGIHSDENEEIIFEFEKDITRNYQLILEIENYFKKLKENSVLLNEQKDSNITENYSSARDFFLSGEVFFEFSNSGLFNFSLGIPDNVKKGVSELHSSLVDVVQDNIDVLKKVCSVERKRSRESWKQYAIETPYGYWAPKEFLDYLYEILDEKASVKSELLKITKKLADKKEVDKIMMPYFQEISESIRQKFPYCDWSHEKLISRWDKWYLKLLKKIENDTDGEFNLMLERYILGVNSCSLPDFWEDTYLRENFESCFLDSLEAKRFSAKQNNQFVRFLKSKYGTCSFDDFSEFEQIITDKKFSKKIAEFLEE